MRTSQNLCDKFTVASFTGFYDNVTVSLGYYYGNLVVTVAKL